MTKSAFRILPLLSLLLGCEPAERLLSPHQISVLDGDTIVVDGSALKLAGFDAPELGPWAKCWAEAALAGHSKSYLESSLYKPENRGWHLSGMSGPDKRGMRTAHLIDSSGYDVADEIVVAGYAAQTDGRWDWCGANANLHDVLEGERAPHGPSVWWPFGPKYDKRAAD
jgi:endonuclease YncB( thermonuclease family)